MKKLIELINKYKKENGPEWISFYEKNGYLECQIEHYVSAYGYEDDYRVDMEYGVEILISKSFGFIKWLVENDKIDRDKCGFKNEGLSGNWYDSGIAFVQNYDNDTYKVSEFYSPYLQLLMLLSISDTPIEDLILYLK